MTFSERQFHRKETNLQNTKIQFDDAAREVSLFVPLACV